MKVVMQCGPWNRWSSPAAATLEVLLYHSFMHGLHEQRHVELWQEQVIFDCCGRLAYDDSQSAVSNCTLAHALRHTLDCTPTWRMDERMNWLN